MDLDGEKQAIMDGVREYSEGYPVELRAFNGALVLTAWNEGHNNNVHVDLLDLAAWMRQGPVARRVDGGFFL